MDYSKYTFIAKANTWFKQGTEVKYICGSLSTTKFNSGIFRGIRRKDDKEDEEMCTFDEFKIYDENGKLTEVRYEHGRKIG